MYHLFINRDSETLVWLKLIFKERMDGPYLSLDKSYIRVDLNDGDECPVFLNVGPAYSDQRRGRYVLYNGRRWAFQARRRIR